MTTLCSTTTGSRERRGQRDSLARAVSLLAILCLAAVGPRAGAGEEFVPEDIRPFANARVTQSSGLGPLDTHLVPVDRITRAGDAARTGPNRTLEGRSRSLTWNHPRGVDADEVFLHLREQLPDDAWFQCDGRGCGASTYWAHDVYGIANLYGRDSSQHYVAVPRSTTEGPAVVMLYVSERGTREVFAHIREILLTGGGAGQSPGSALAAGLRETGVARLPEAPFDSDGGLGPEAERILAAMEQALAALPTNEEVWIVVHMAGDAQTMIEASSIRARRLRDALQAPDLRLRAFGIGPLAPSVLGEAKVRVEMVRAR